MERKNVILYRLFLKSTYWTLSFGEMTKYIIHCLKQLWEYIVNLWPCYTCLINSYIKNFSYTQYWIFVALLCLDKNLAKYPKLFISLLTIWCRTDNHLKPDHVFIFSNLQKCFKDSRTHTIYWKQNTIWCQQSPIYLFYKSPIQKSDMPHLDLDLSLIWFNSFLLLTCSIQKMLNRMHSFHLLNCIKLLNVTTIRNEDDI